MNSCLDELYAQIGQVKIFESMPECVNCDAKCNSPRRERWLLKEEADRLNGSLPDIVEINGARFFAAGRCTKLLAGGKCGIYGIRPLECRLNPVAFTEKDGRLYWMLNRACKLLKADDVERIDYFKGKAAIYIDAIERFFPPHVWAELHAINRAINSFDPYVEGEDCITLREVKETQDVYLSKGITVA